MNLSCLAHSHAWKQPNAYLASLCLTFRCLEKCSLYAYIYVAVDLATFMLMLVLLYKSLVSTSILKYTSAALL